MTKTINNITAAFSALGDKTRFKIYELLNKHSEICVSELAGEVGISTAGVSQQLQVLEKAGLIERKRMGQKICYQVVDRGELNKDILKIVRGK